MPGRGRGAPDVPGAQAGRDRRLLREQGRSAATPGPDPRRRGRLRRQDRLAPRFKDDVAEVRDGFECGIGIENFQDIKEGDVIEAYEVERSPAPSSAHRSSRRFDLRIPDAAPQGEAACRRSRSRRDPAKFNVSVAEVDHHDLWQRTAIGVARWALTVPPPQGRPRGGAARRRWVEVEVIDASSCSTSWRADGADPGARTDRVGEEFREILAEQIQKLKDPRVGFVDRHRRQGLARPQARRGSPTRCSATRRSGRARARRCARPPRTCAASLGREVRLKFAPGPRVRGGHQLPGGPADRRAHRGAPPQGARVSAAPDFARAAEILTEATEVALACHVNPDADALGSMLGLADFLRGRGASHHGELPERAARAAALGRAAAGLRAAGAAQGVPQGARRDGHVRLRLRSIGWSRSGHAAEKAGELIWIDHHRSQRRPGHRPAGGSGRVLDVRDGLPADRVDGRRHVRRDRRCASTPGW